MCDYTPGSFVEIHRYHGPSGVETVQPGFGSVAPGGFFTVTEMQPPDPCAYYRISPPLTPACRPVPPS